MKSDPFGIVTYYEPEPGGYLYAMREFAELVDKTNRRARRRKEVRERWKTDFRAFRAGASPAWIKQKYGIVPEEESGYRWITKPIWDWEFRVRLGYRTDKSLVDYRNRTGL